MSRLDPNRLFYLGKILSFVAYYVLSERRRVISVELAKSYAAEWPAGKIKKSVRNSFRIYVCSQLKMFSLSKLNSLIIDKFITVDGLECLDKALEKKRGVIILNPHFGPFMLIMPALGYRGYKVSQLALQGEPPWGARKGIDKKIYDIKFKSIECNMPVKFINAALGTFSLREAIRTLKNNEIILYPSTGMGGTAFHTVTLMRRKSSFSLTPFKMALTTGAVLMPAFVICDDVRTTLKLETAIDMGNFTAEELAERYAEILDYYIECYPDHFLMYLYEVYRNTRMGAAPFFLDEPSMNQPVNKLNDWS